MIGVQKPYYKSLNVREYHPEQLKIGFDYTVMHMLALRCGYATSCDESNGISFGLGISKFGFTFDYAYTPFGIFDNVHTVALKFSF